MPRNRRFRKTYAFGIKTDRQCKLDEEDRKLRRKWKRHYEQGFLSLGSISAHRYANTYARNRRCILGGKKGSEILVVESCLRCGKEQPITPIYFLFDKHSRSVSNLHVKSGKEFISNTRTRGCRECSRKVGRERSRCREEFLRVLLKAYPKLSREWYDRHPNICSISNLPLCEQSGRADWKVSIQNDGPTQDHLPELCTKIAYEFNVQEQKAIGNLLECWKEAFQEMMHEMMQPSDTDGLLNELSRKWTNTPSMSGVNVPSKVLLDQTWKKNPEYMRQLRQCHLPTILAAKLRSYVKMDKKSKRNPRMAGIPIQHVHLLYDKLVKQKFRCYYTDIPFSLNRDDWRHFSLERLDNSLNHTDSNTVFICRMFNTPGQLNRQKIAKALLSQIHVPLINEVKEMLEMYLNDRRF